MKLRVIFENSGGILDSRIVNNEAQAAKAAVEMIGECNQLCHGDVIRVVEIEDESR